MKGLTDLSIGGAIGFFIGIAFAEWVDPPATATYVVLVAASIIFFSLVGKVVAFFWRRRTGGDSGDAGP